MTRKAVTLWLLVLAMAATGLSISMARIKNGHAGQSSWAGPEAGPGAGPFADDAAGQAQAAQLDAFTGMPLGNGDEPAYLGIVVENSPAARPVSGVEDASLVYEVPAEGGITRFLALFSHAPRVAVGPVRSIRPYIIDLVSSHGAPVAFCGGSEAALAMIKQMKYPAVNELSKPAGFFRDSARHAPHNLYASPDALMKRIAGAGIAIDGARTGFVYGTVVAEVASRESSVVGAAGATGAAAPARVAGAASAGAADPARPARGVSARMGVNYTVSWEYAAESGAYIRSVNGRPDVDRSGEHTLAAENVVVVFAATKVLDAEGRLAVGLEGSGKAVVATRGSVIQARWERAAGEPLKLVAEAGGDVILRPGRTWVHVVDEYTRLDIVED